MKYLYITYSTSDDFETIKCLPNKEDLLYLEIAYCKDGNFLPIADISYLEGFTGLIYLGLGGNDIRDLSPISNMTPLEILFLYENFNIETLEPLYNLTNITQGIIPSTYQYTAEDFEHLGDPMSSNFYYD